MPKHGAGKNESFFGFCCSWLIVYSSNDPLQMIGEMIISSNVWKLKFDSKPVWIWISTLFATYCNLFIILYWSSSNPWLDLKHWISSRTPIFQMQSRTHNTCQPRLSSNLLRQPLTEGTSRLALALPQVMQRHIPIKGDFGKILSNLSAKLRL